MTGVLIVSTIGCMALGHWHPAAYAGAAVLAILAFARCEDRQRKPEGRYIVGRGR